MTDELKAKDADAEAKKTVIMISFEVEVNEDVYNFLKDYSEFFGSHMTYKQLAAQMIYEETRRLHLDLTRFLGDKYATKTIEPIEQKPPHYAGAFGWIRQYPKIAETISEYPEGWATTPIEDIEEKP